MNMVKKQLILLFLIYFFVQIQSSSRLIDPERDTEIESNETYLVSQTEQQIILKYNKKEQNTRKIVVQIDQQQNFIQQDNKPSLCVYSQSYEPFCDIEGLEIDYHSLYVEYTEQNQEFIEQETIYISIELKQNRNSDYHLKLLEITEGQIHCPNSCNNSPNLCQEQYEVCACKNSSKNFYLDGRDCSIETKIMFPGDAEKITLQPQEQYFLRYHVVNQKIQIQLEKIYEEQNMKLEMNMKLYNQLNNRLPIERNNSSFYEKSTTITTRLPKNSSKQTDYLKIGLMNMDSQSAITFKITIDDRTVQTQDEEIPEEKSSKTKLIEIILLCAILFTFFIAIIIALYIYKDYKKHRHIIARVEKIKKEKEKKKKDINDYVPKYKYKNILKLKKTQDDNAPDSPQNDQQKPNPDFKFNIEKVLAEDSCAICLIEFEEDEDVRVTICDHIFHTECIDDWYVKQQICPSCRQDLTKEGIENRDQQKQGQENEKKEKNEIERRESIGFGMKHHKVQSSQQLIRRRNSSVINSSQNFNLQFSKDLNFDTQPKTTEITPQKIRLNMDEIQSYKKNGGYLSSEQTPVYSYGLKTDFTQATPSRGGDSTFKHLQSFKDVQQSKEDLQGEENKEEEQIKQQQDEKDGEKQIEQITEQIQVLSSKNLPQINTDDEQEDPQEIEQEEQRDRDTVIIQKIMPNSPMDSPKDMPKLTTDNQSQRPMLLLQSTDRNRTSRHLKSNKSLSIFSKNRGDSKNMKHFKL